MYVQQPNCGSLLVLGPRSSGSYKLCHSLFGINVHSNENKCLLPRTEMQNRHNSNDFWWKIWRKRTEREVSNRMRSISTNLSGWLTWCLDSYFPKQLILYFWIKKKKKMLLKGIQINTFLTTIDNCVNYTELSDFYRVANVLR